MPNAARPANGAAENRLIHHGLAFLFMYLAGRVETQRLGFSTSASIAGHRCHTAPIQVRTPNTNILSGDPTQGQCRWGWYPRSSSFVDQNCVYDSMYFFYYTSAFRMSSKGLMVTKCLVLKETFQHLRIPTGIYQAGLKRENYSLTDGESGKTGAVL